jgi:hypothetical protein
MKNIQTDSIFVHAKSGYALCILLMLAFILTQIWFQDYVFIVPYQEKVINQEESWSQLILEPEKLIDTRIQNLEVKRSGKESINILTRRGRKVNSIDRSSSPISFFL